MAGRKRQRETQAAAEERAMKRIDRAVKRYGPSAVAKYYSPSTSFRPETKYFDCMFDTNIANGGDWTNDYVPMSSYIQSDGSTVGAYTDAALIPSAIGNGYGQVIGNKYLIKKLKVRGTIEADNIAATAGDAGGMVRIMLCQDTQPNGAQVDPATFLTDWGDSAQLLNSFQSISAGSGGRIRILADRFIMLDTTEIGTTNQIFTKRQFSFSKSWKKGLKVVVKSGSATPTVASLSDMNLFMVAHTQGNVAGNQATIRMVGCTRCAYVD